MGTNLTAICLVFLLLPDKVYADVIYGLQYRVAKMQTKSEMHVKYVHMSTNTGYQLKLHHK